LLLARFADRIGAGARRRAGAEAGWSVRVRVADAIAEAAITLNEAHVPSSRVDAEWLAAHVLGVARGRLALVAEFTAEQLTRYRALVGRRATRIPLQHLVGTAAFRHLELAVGDGVFIPRPETETVVDWGLAWLGKRPGALVADLCAGSGAIAISVAVEAPGSRVYAVEQDEAALGWLRRNVSEFGLPDQEVTVVTGDATDAGVLADLDGTVDLVLTNPPYVPEVAASGLPLEVSAHDPHAAVFGGVDGLSVIRPLIGRIAGLLRPGGAFAMEHDDTHAYVVPTLVDADGRFDDVRLHHDLGGRPRFTTATRTR
jgi:release factor glutamine methyltransferase